MIGLRGIHVDSPDRIAAAWDEALASPVPVVLEERTDPKVPPLPPHFTLKQAHAFVASLPSDPDRGSVLANTARRSEEHTSELQSLMRISYAVFCLKKKKNTLQNKTQSRAED